MHDRIGPIADTALPTRRVLAVGLVALALVAAGCLGGGGGDTTTVATSEQPTTTEDATTTQSTTSAAATTGTTAGTTTTDAENTTLGITVENTSGEAIANATVEIAEEGGGVLDGIFGDDATDPGAVGPDGGVTVDLASGNYSIEATANGYAPGAQTVAINGTDTNVTLTLNETAGLTPTTAENATTIPTPPGNETIVTPDEPGNGTPIGAETQYLLNVTVADGSDAPVENASVEVADEGGPLSSLFGENQDAGSVNAEGIVSVEVANGSYTVTANADGFAEGQRDVEVNGSAANVTVTLNQTTTSG